MGSETHVCVHLAMPVLERIVKGDAVRCEDAWLLEMSFSLKYFGGHYSLEMFAFR